MSVAIFFSILFVRSSINCAKSSMVMFLFIVHLSLYAFTLPKTPISGNTVAAGAVNCTGTAGCGAFLPLAWFRGAVGRDFGVWCDFWSSLIGGGTIQRSQRASLRIINL